MGLMSEARAAPPKPHAERDRKWRRVERYLISSRSLMVLAQVQRGVVIHDGRGHRGERGNLYGGEGRISGIFPRRCNDSLKFFRVSINGFTPVDPGRILIRCYFSAK